MRKGLLVPIMLSLVLLPSLPGFAGWIVLDQVQVVPAPTNVPGAVGTGIVELEEDEGELYYDITVTGLSGPITAAHFHGPAGPGESASPVRAVTFEGNHAVGEWSSTDSEPLTPDLITALKEGKIYFNVHTELNGDGEIRGQVHVEPSFNGGMNQVEELPAPQPVPGAAGTVFAILNEAETELTFNATVTGLSGPITASHFHGPAASGASASPVFTVTMTGNHAEGVWKSMDSQPLTPDLVQALKNGLLYFNIHTALNPPGEIRGQLFLTDEEEDESNVRSWDLAK